MEHSGCKVVNYSCHCSAAPLSDGRDDYSRARDSDGLFHCKQKGCLVDEPLSFSNGQSG